ncbi:hypothetical protein CALCODRAFT_519567 [Calocera cornea HHB12733]|uniref:Uncharacterized protein n=1 Tax=Calocera cornea HHB12733 TaxID=1353952 RepID=A0A165E5W4_9BASI|nr:hypothetical protein CALCODRAFT_519567 [Calocera cornea HHB12733]
MVVQAWHMQGIWIPFEHLQEWWAQQPEDQMMCPWNPRSSHEMGLGLAKRLESEFGITMKNPKVKQTADYCDLWVYKRPSKEWGYREVFFMRRLVHGHMKPSEMMRESDQKFAEKLRHAGFKKMVFAMLEHSYEGRRDIERDHVVWRSEEWTETEESEGRTKEEQ